MVVILLATGALARLADVAMASVVQVTSVGGGGLLTPDNLVGADQRAIAWSLLRMLLPGLIVQALVIKLVVTSYRGLSIPFIGTAAVLGAFDLASLGVASLVAHGFVESRSLARPDDDRAGDALPVARDLGRDAGGRGLRAPGPGRAARAALPASRRPVVVAG